METYFCGKSWDAVLLGTAAKHPAPGSAPWVLGCQVRQDVLKDLALMQPHLRAQQSSWEVNTALGGSSQGTSVPQDPVFSLHPRMLQWCVG